MSSFHYSAHVQKTGPSLPSRRSRFLVLTKRGLASGDEKCARVESQQQERARKLCSTTLNAVLVPLRLCSLKKSSQGACAVSFRVLTRQKLRQKICCFRYLLEVKNILSHALKAGSFQISRRLPLPQGKSFKILASMS